MRAMLPGLLCLLTVPGTGCDRGAEIEGLERRIELLQEEQLAAAKAREALADKVDTATQAVAERQAESEAVQAELDSAESRIAYLETQIEQLQQKHDEPAKPTFAGRPDPAERYRVDVGTSPVKGSKDAKVTIVIFSDFQCPFCKRVQGTLDEVEREYGKDVRIVAKHNPLPMHREALSAAIAAEAAHRQNKFWELHDLLYENGRDLTRDNFIKWAKKVGCSTATFEKDLEDRDLEDRIKDDQALAAKLGARGVPAFFINGRFLSGAQPFTAFKSVIDEEMKEVERRIAAGTPASAVYADLMRTAKSGV